MGRRSISITSSPGLGMGGPYLAVAMALDLDLLRLVTTVGRP